MLKFYDDTKIFVHCPSGIVTGGAELLHQLVSYLRQHGRDAYIIYFGEYEHVVPMDYSEYTIETTNSVEDTPHNIEIFYEGIFDMVSIHASTQKFLWWISVDHFYTCAASYLHPLDLYRYDKKKGISWFCVWIKRSLQQHKNLFSGLLSIKKLASMNVVSGYQAEYIQDFLLHHGFEEVVPLKDYINADHCKSFDKTIKEDIVLYNPSKGIEYTKSLMELAPDFQWIALKGLSRQQLIQLLQKAKVYIDFGYHPGKDRLPRECAMNGCCVITGKRGSARFFEDVSIPPQYKFDEKKADKHEIISQIRWIMDNYTTAIDDYRYYRASISAEKNEFEAQINKIFDIC